MFRIKYYITKSGHYSDIIACRGVYIFAWIVPKKLTYRLINGATRGIIEEGRGQSLRSIKKQIRARLLALGAQLYTGIQNK